MVVGLERQQRIFEMVVLGVPKSEAWGGLTVEESALWDSAVVYVAEHPGAEWWLPNEMPG